MAAVWDEMKRRNVVRVAIAYSVVSWLTLQFADVLIPLLGLPEWVGKLIFLLLAIGFPLALVFAWAYELTPEGLKREHQVDRSQSIAGHTGRKLDFTIIAMLAAAVIFLIVDNYVLDRAPVANPDIDRSIAVLPFRNRSSIAEDAFFVDGMADDLVTLLSRLSSVEKVISRTSTEQYRDTTKPMPQIGQELGVATTLVGGVQRSGNQVRINVQLIDTNTDQNLWAQTYNRVLTVENLFQIQSEITREIVAALHGVLSEQDKETLQVMPTSSLEAYAEFILGRQAVARRTGESMLRATTHFEKAIEFDSNYALAYVGLANAYILLPEYLGTQVEDIFVPLQTAIDKALSIDPLSGEAYTALAGLVEIRDTQEESEKYYLKAIDLNPNYATAHHWYSLVLRDAGRAEESLAQILKAVELDPLAPILKDNLANMQIILGRHQDANTTLREGLAQDPKFPGLHSVMSELLVDEGRLGEALMWAQSASKLNPTNTSYSLRKCDLYLGLGDDQSGESCFAALKNDFPEGAYGYITRLYCYQSRSEDALDLLRRQEDREQDPSTLRDLAWYFVACGDSSGARSILEGIDPNLFGDGDVAIAPNEFYSTVAAAYSLYVDDETDRADYLFDQALDAMHSTSRLSGFGASYGYGYGVLDTFIHVTRGDQQSAVLALRDAVQSGWRADWRELRSPHYASMQGNPEWIELLAEIETDIRQQRKWFEEHKDDPLF